MLTRQPDVGHVGVVALDLREGAKSGAGLHELQREARTPWPGWPRDVAPPVFRGLDVAVGHTRRDGPRRGPEVGGGCHAPDYRTHRGDTRVAPGGGVASHLSTKCNETHESVKSLATLVVIIAAAIGIGAMGAGPASAARCADFPKQAAAQAAANTRDANGNGVYCETLPCPCAAVAGRSSGGSPATPPSSGDRSTSVQAQPDAGSCRMRGSGVTALPDPRCTPGATNPAVTNRTLGQTICRPGWTATVRPPESVTSVEKGGSMAAYGVTGPRSAYEYDHLIPLELGGATNSPKNLWPEPNDPGATGFYRNSKDKLENSLKRQVCNGTLSLGVAQQAIARNWVAAARQYG